MQKILKSECSCSHVSCLLAELHFCPEVIRLSSTTAAVIWKQDPEEEYNGSYVVSYGMTENQLDNNISYSSRGEECLNGLIEYKLRIAQLNSSAQYYFQLHATQTSMTQLSMCGSVALPPIPG